LLNISLSSGPKNGTSAYMLIDLGQTVSLLCHQTEQILRGFASKKSETQEVDSLNSNVSQTSSLGGKYKPSFPSAVLKVHDLWNLSAVS
jgi:hypothetical protein